MVSTIILIPFKTILTMLLFVTHVVIILLLLWSAITLHFLTIKIQKNETQKRKKPQKKVLHSKPRWYQTVIEETPTFTTQKPNGL